MQACASQPNRMYQPRRPRKYRLGYQLMTKQEAMAIRVAHLQGGPVLALELQEACRVLRMGHEPRKLHLPELSRPERERCNAVLLFNLGRALGHIELQRDAAPCLGLLSTNWSTT